MKQKKATTHLSTLIDWNALNIDIIPSSKFLSYFKRVIHGIHPGLISTLSKTSLNGYSNVVQCLLKLLKMMLLFDSFILIKPPCFGQINLGKLDSHTFDDTCARILQARLIKNLSL